MQQNIEGFIRTLDQLGLENMPRQIKISIVLIFLFSPILVVLLCIWLTQAENIEESKKSEEQIGKSKKEN